MENQEKNETTVLPENPEIMVKNPRSGKVRKLEEEVRRQNELEQLRTKRIRKEQETPDTFERLKQIFSECKGETVVYLQLVDQNRTIRTEKNFWINPNAATIKKMEAVLGSGSVLLA